MRIFLSQLIAKLISSFLKLLNIGAGETWPGFIALTLFPDILDDLGAKLCSNSKIIVISGTNGKTTTAKILSTLLASKNFLVLNNETGANMPNGIVSTLLLKTPLFGAFPYNFVVLEVDEFALPTILYKLPVDVLILLNLSRDQLDRYGETDIILSKWESLVASLNGSTKLIIDATQPVFARLPHLFKGHTFYFDDSQVHQAKSPLKGKFNMKNINAAFCALNVLGFDSADFVGNLSDINPAYGRGELLGKYNIYLAKNPASFNNNLELLTEFEKTTAILIILNDNIPDGRDVSWIYDIESTMLLLLTQFDHIYISGTRCLDMAVRLNYAGVTTNKENISPDTRKIIMAINANTLITKVLVFPNYSGMLTLRKLLIGRSIL